MDWTAIIWAGVSGLLAGAVSGGVEWAIRKRFANLSPAKRMSLATASFLIVFLPVRDYSGRYEVLEFVCPLLPERVAVQLRIEHHGWRLMSVPAIARMLKSAPSKAAALQISRQLTAQGVRRLDDSTLLQRALLFSRMLAAVDEAHCAALMRGTATQDTLLSALEGADALNAWFDMTFKAAMAEVEQWPTRELTEPEIDHAVAALRRQLPKDQADRVLDAIAQPADLPDRDLCSAARALYQTVTAMSDPGRGLLLRALTQ